MDDIPEFPVPPSADGIPPADRGIFVDEALLGGDIVQEIPNDMHFILGIAYFDMNPTDPSNPVADNRQFRDIVSSYFRQTLQNDQEFVNSLRDSAGRERLRVLGQIDGILAAARATPLERLDGMQLPDNIRIWKKQTSAFLRETTWQTYYFRDISGDQRQLRQSLQEPLRTALRNALKVHQQNPAPRTPQSSHQQPHPPSPPQPLQPLQLPPSPPPPMRELDADEDTLVRDVCTGINSRSPYVASLVTLYNEQEPMSANQYLAERVAERWCNEETSKPRFVYWINAADPDLVVTGYMRQIRKLRAELDIDTDFAAPPKMPRLAPQSAASEFLNVLWTTFPKHCECLLVYTNVGHPDVFSDGFLPSQWLQDPHCLATIRGVLLCTAHPAYNGHIGPQFGLVKQIPVEWRGTNPDQGHAQWWNLLPTSNLPPLFEDVKEPQDMDRLLQQNGRAAALVDPDPYFSGKVANQFARRWERGGGQGRFSFWLNAADDARLKDAYNAAMRTITFSSANHPFGNPSDLSARNMADSLMSLLTRKRELSEQEQQWTLIFENPSPSWQFHEKCFSSLSNWWNSWGRFIVTTSSPPIHLDVEINGEYTTVPIPFINCREDESVRHGAGYGGTGGQSPGEQAGNGAPGGLYPGGQSCGRHKDGGGFHAGRRGKDGDGGATSFVPVEVNGDNQESRRAGMLSSPSDLTHNEGGFQGARQRAEESKCWLLINIQKDSDSSSQVLNRDVWQNELVRDVIQENFVFWQETDSSIDGRNYVQQYYVAGFPHIAILNPCTGSLVLRKDGWTLENPLTAESFTGMVMDVCMKNPYDGLSTEVMSTDAEPPSNPEHSSSLSEDEQFQAALAASLEDVSILAKGKRGRE